MYLMATTNGISFIPDSSILKLLICSGKTFRFNSFIPIGLFCANILYNIPSDAELVRPYLGSNEMTSMESIKYKKSFNGAMNHAFYISVSGCKKVLKYAKKYKWKYSSDVDLYRLGVGSGGFPTGFDGWSFSGNNDYDNVSNLIPEEDKIHMYSMDHIIFNQTSLPCVPFK